MNIIKLLKNQKNPPNKITIKSAGISIPAIGQYTIQPQEYALWTTQDIVNELTPYIDSGDIVVNDGVRDLTAAEGIRYIEKVETVDAQWNNVDIVKSPIQLNFQGDVSVADGGGGKATILIGQSGTPSGKLIDFFFVASGNTADKWLGVGNGSTASNLIPYILPWSANLVSLTFTNQDNNVDIDVLIYKNGILLYTWDIRNKRTAWKTNASLGSFSQGDRLSCFLKKYLGGTGDSTAQDPIVELTLVVDLANSGEGGTQYGV